MTTKKSKIACSSGVLRGHSSGESWFKVLRCSSWAMLNARCTSATSWWKTKLSPVTFLIVSKIYLDTANIQVVLYIGFHSRWTTPIFTVWRYASAVYAVVMCLRVSVTLQYCIKTAKRKITQIMPHDSTRALVFWCQRSRRNSNGITPYGGAKRRLGRLKSATFDE